MAMINDDAPTYELLRHETVRARKRHACIYCKDPIAKGEQHTVHVYLYDGKFCAERYHHTCPQDRQE